MSILPAEKSVGDLPIVVVSTVVDFVGYGEVFKSFRLKKSPEVAPPNPILAPNATLALEF